MIFKSIADLAVSLLGLQGNLADAVHFWVYDSTKIITLLFLIVFAVGYFRTYMSNEKIRDYLEGKNNFFGYFLAAILGVLSPFCSCSTIPIFLGFISAGIPFGMTITFLFVSPLVNEAAVVVLFGTLGLKTTLAYILGGVLVGVTGGLILSKTGMEKYIKEFDLPSEIDKSNQDKITRKERAKQALSEGKEIIKSVLPYVIIGVGIGALIHGFVPTEVITKYLSGALAVPAAVAVGVPIYTNIMGVIPVTESLIGKGLPVGTALAFMMSVAALSLPQFVMLKKVMKKELLIAYGVILSAGIVFLGFVFNFLL